MSPAPLPRAPTTVRTGAGAAAFPWLSPRQAMVVLRVTVAGLFLAHALVRIASGTIPQFGGFLERAGLPAGVPLVWAITLFELGGGVLLAVGRATRWMAGGFCVLLVAGIVLIHRHLGWFVGEHGTGGSEYSVALLAALVTIAANAAPREG
ncbi:MAG: DoxX family protein [Gemmatimonadaceae bacterium]|nr:DoxX family protein [Gemmatimonadaceae bacterium]